MGNVFQYTPTGDNGIYFQSMDNQGAAYTLTATPYSKSNPGGVAGRPFTIHFTAVDKNTSAFSSRITAGANDGGLQGEGV